MLGIFLLKRSLFLAYFVGEESQIFQMSLVFGGFVALILLMEEILHQLIGSLSHHLQVFVYIQTVVIVGFLNHQQ